MLAHQGGWDEVLLVLAPLSIFALLLYLANVRATRQLEVASPARRRGPGTRTARRRCRLTDLG